MIHGGFKLKGKTYRSIKSFLSRKKRDNYSMKSDDRFYDANDSSKKQIKKRSRLTPFFY